MMLRRFKEKPKVGRPNVLPVDHIAAVAGQTRYRKTVRSPASALRVLKSGMNSKKIGARVQKGKWRGMPIFTLTLEERATCPRSCQVWLSCYGNSMHWAQRFEHGPALEGALDCELAGLQRRYPKGFVVRLHVLGDFYSIGYVDLWRAWLLKFPALRVFGYTAHLPFDSEIGRALNWLSMKQWDRFAIRFSHSGMGVRATDIDGITCPAQTGKTECCATCGLCWQTTKNIHFLEH